MPRKFPDWYINADIPAHLRQRLEATFTPHRDGWVRWHDGKTVFVCSKHTPPAEVEQRWATKKDDLAKVAAPKTAGKGTVREAASDFFAYIDHRVKTGQPEPLSEVTQADYERTLTAFGGTRPAAGAAKIADTRLADLGPEHFTAFAKRFAGQAPSTLGRNVAYVRSFIQFCVDEGLLDGPPQFGRYFAKPGKQKHRDARMSQAKRFSREEIAALLKVATTEERAWIMLGLNCGFDNSDLAHLTRDVVGEFANDRIDFSRRKVGKQMRLCPLWSATIAAMKDYVRPKPAKPEHAGLYFLTPTGLPLGRVMRSKTGKPHRVDYVSMCWSRLLARAGLRPKPKTERVGGKRKMVYAKEGRGVADRRGFRALRTTFSNLAPRGYRDEVEIILGHLSGVLLENYIEEHGVGPLRELTEAVRAQLFTSPRPPGATGRRKKVA